jgi:2-oxoglutarate dehydrogenase E1 component
MKELQHTLDSMKPEMLPAEDRPEQPPPGAARHTSTAVSADRLRGLINSLSKVPEGFSLHPKVARVRERSREAFDRESKVSWAIAEELAFGSILEDGIAIRLSGEDSERGTFSQRHAAFYDTANGQRYVRLQTLSTARAAFEVCNSPLSENAVVGFEFGYSIQKPGQLVLWEAQYGDFVNGAQVMLDEFIVSARAKWGQRPSLVLLLPHGYEGQGPNHSSCRVERFLSLAVDTNLRIANCTTAAQYFHLLRRQAALLKQDPLPLIVLTPKSLLRDPRLVSSLDEFTSGKWNPVIGESASVETREKIHNLVLCSGKIFFELDRVERPQDTPVALARVEQFYPYPSEEIEAILSSYPHLEQVHWVQEEPENMGAWNYLRPHLTAQLDGRWPLYYTGRPASSSPAEGSASWHRRIQSDIIERTMRPR